MRKNSFSEYKSSRAFKILNSFYPDKGMSAICENRINNCNYDLDVIVPCFNVQDYVCICIDSLIRQKTGYRFRIIIIDDGSTDNTGEQIDEFKNNSFSDIIIIHQKNTGLSGARNKGLDLLDAKYVMFVDSDDSLFGEAAIDQLLKVAFEKDADIVEGGAHFVNGHKICHIDNRNNGKMSVSNLRGQPWGKVIKSSLFKKICYPLNYWYEDSIMRQLVYPLANTDKVFGINNIVYKYNSNPNSITHQSKKKAKRIDSLYITLKLYEDRHLLEIPNNLDYYEYLLRMAELSFQRILFLPYKVKKAFFELYSNFISCEFSDYKSIQSPEIEYCLKHNNYILFFLKFWVQKIYSRIRPDK